MLIFFLLLLSSRYWIAIDVFFSPSECRDSNRLVDDFFNVMLNDKLTYCIALSCIASYSYPMCLVMVFLILKK